MSNYVNKVEKNIKYYKSFKDKIRLNNNLEIIEFEENTYSSFYYNIILIKLKNEEVIYNSLLNNYKVLLRPLDEIDLWVNNFDQGALKFINNRFIIHLKYKSSFKELVELENLLSKN